MRSDAKNALAINFGVIGFIFKSTSTFSFVLKSSLGNPSTTTREEEEEEEGFVFGKFAKAKAKRIWNESVDFTFKPIVEYLSRKGY